MKPISKIRAENDKQLALDLPRPNTYEVADGKLPINLKRRYDDHGKTNSK